MALRLVFHGPEQRARAVFLDQCSTIQGLENFYAAAAAKYRLLLIIDQVNALDAQDEAMDRFTLTSCMRPRTIIRAWDLSNPGSYNTNSWDPGPPSPTKLLTVGMYTNHK